MLSVRAVNDYPVKQVSKSSRRLVEQVFARLEGQYCVPEQTAEVNVNT